MDRLLLLIGSPRRARGSLPKPKPPVKDPERRKGPIEDPSRRKGPLGDPEPERPPRRDPPRDPNVPQPGRIGDPPKPGVEGGRS